MHRYISVIGEAQDKILTLEKEMSSAIENYYTEAKTMCSGAVPRSITILNSDSVTFCHPVKAKISSTVGAVFPLRTHSTLPNHP